MSRDRACACRERLRDRSEHVTQWWESRETRPRRPRCRASDTRDRTPCNTQHTYMRIHILPVAVLRRARGHSPLQIVARPPSLAVLLTHCGHLILWKISIFYAPRCQILRLKCTEFDFRCGPVRKEERKGKRRGEVRGGQPPNILA